MENLEKNKLQKLAEEFAVMIQTKAGTISRMNAEEWFKAGFEKAESLNEKKFSEVQIAQAIAYGFEICKTHNRAAFDNEIIKFIQSLRTNCEIEIQNNCVTVTKIL